MNECHEESLTKIGKGFLPNTDYLTNKELSKLYEPSDDSYLLIDSLIEDFEFIKQRNTVICCEVGSGSGVISKTLALLFKANNIKQFFLAIDISEFAVHATKNAFSSCNISPPFASNKVSYDVIQGDLFTSFNNDILKIDVLVFNPPYVVTESAEVESSILARTWAGGKFGREVIDKFLLQAQNVISDYGVVYLLCILENKPEEICSLMRARGFANVKIILKRVAQNEALFVLRGSK